MCVRKFLLFKLPSFCVVQLRILKDVLISLIGILNDANFPEASRSPQMVFCKFVVKIVLKKDCDKIKWSFRIVVDTSSPESIFLYSGWDFFSPDRNFDKPFVNLLRFLFSR